MCMKTYLQEVVSAISLNQNVGDDAEGVWGQAHIKVLNYYIWNQSYCLILKFISQFARVETIYSEIIQSPTSEYL